MPEKCFRAHSVKLRVKNFCEEPAPEPIASLVSYAETAIKSARRAVIRNKFNAVAPINVIAMTKAEDARGFCGRAKDVFSERPCHCAFSIYMSSMHLWLKIYFLE